MYNCGQTYTANKVTAHRCPALLRRFAHDDKPVQVPGTWMPTKTPGCPTGQPGVFVQRAAPAVPRFGLDGSHLIGYAPRYRDRGPGTFRASAQRHGSKEDHPTTTPVRLPLASTVMVTASLVSAKSRKVIVPVPPPDALPTATAIRTRKASAREVPGAMPSDRTASAISAEERSRMMAPALPGP